MIDFDCSKRAKDGTPIIHDTDIHDYAEALLAEYKGGKYLKEPGKLKPEHFAESYLGATIEPQDIYYEEGEPPIWGAAVFNNEYVRVFDRENKTVKSVAVRENTILLDNATLADGMEGFADFTVLHESGHLCLHQAVYRRAANQFSLFDGMDISPRSVVCCRKNVLDGGKRGKLITEEDHREHQANVFAAALSMPRPTFIPTAQEIIRSLGFKDGICVVPSEIGWDYNFVDVALIERLVDIFGRSKTATRIQLQRYGLMMDEMEYEMRSAGLGF